MKRIKGFTDFITESLKRDRKDFLKNKGLTPDHGLHGELIEDFATDLVEIMGLCPNLESISIPTNSLTSKSVNINREGKDWQTWDRAVEPDEALTQIIDHLTELSDEADSRGEIVTFSIWHFQIPGKIDLEKALIEFGGSGESQEIDTRALIKFLKQNTELAANAIRFSITYDSQSDRDFTAAMSRGDLGSLD